jgi:uncharacterized protein YqgQ
MLWPDEMINYLFLKIQRGEMKKKLQNLYSARLSLYRLYQDGILNKNAYLRAIQPLDEKVDQLECATLPRNSFSEKVHG